MALLPPDPLFCLRADMDHIHSVCFLEDGNVANVLVAATDAGLVYFWDLETNRLKFKMSMGSSIQAIHVFGSDLLTQHKDGTITQWIPDEDVHYSSKSSFQCDGGFCKSFAYSNQLLVPMKDAVGILDVTTMELIRSLKVNKECLGQLMAVHRTTLNDGGVYVLGGFESGDVLLWNSEEGSVVGGIKLRECITSLTYDKAMGRGVCVGASKMLQIFTIDKSLKMCLKTEIEITNEGCNVVRLREDKKIFVTGGWDGRLRVFSWKSLRLLAVLDEHKLGVSDVQFSAFPAKGWNKKIIAASSGDGTISLWSLYN
ncbi:PREDICTED: guanine nucleotide-binding protein subunit beta-like protein 1 [Nicrophorus vespilloides]|uniref:Guanine nucleotide-binding protein subunit beta-like protein 1 n=1 Tax=Nicrophorus vespilloides TaxID=110193 RepID=A0ABM1M0Y3_NICVS|nr:PREDICTED: guanine nucleotide-binding protein subunit beta-like protein 1 [Nicrophorus vespilloides]